MKKAILLIALILIVIPSFTFAQVTATSNSQIQAAFNSQLLVLIQSLLEQVKVLQQKLAEIQKQQMKMTLEADELKAETAESLAKITPSPIIPTPSPVRKAREGYTFLCNGQGPEVPIYMLTIPNRQVQVCP